MDGALDLVGGGEGASKVFTKVLEFLDEKIVASQKQWERRSVLFQSLCQRVPSERVVKEFKIWGNIQLDLESFALAEDHHLVYFHQTEEECEVVLKGGP